MSKEINNAYHNFEDLEDDFNSLKKFYKKYDYDKISQISKGENLKIAILDSGVDLYHPFLVNRLDNYYSVFSNDDDVLDRNGHGTSIAGLICGKKIGLLQKANISIVKITHEDVITENSVVCGLKWCIKNNINIICMAFGTSKNFSKIKKYIDYCNELGIIMIASAGNDSKELLYPSRYKSVISVGSIDYLDNIPDFSVFGEDLDLVLPAVKVPTLYAFSKFTRMTGSSIATAIAVIYVSLLQNFIFNTENRLLTLEELRKDFSENSEDLGVVGKDRYFGYGIPSFKKRINKFLNFKDE